MGDHGEGRGDGGDRIEIVSLRKQKFMLGNQSIMAFVPTTDAGRARPFYEKTLGLKVSGDRPDGAGPWVGGGGL